MKHQSHQDRTAILALAYGIAKTRIPLIMKDVPADSPLIEALRLAYEGRGMVLVHPSSDPSTVSLSAYPTSIRGVSALASDVFHNGFQRIAPRYRLDLAA